MIWLLPWEEHNGVKHTHFALYLVLLANVTVYAVMASSSGTEIAVWIGKYALVAGDLHWYQWITSMYLHAGLMHLVGNMLFLWLFGDNVEDVLGPIGFLLLYHVGGIAGSLLYATSNPSELIPSLGASGGVATVAGAYAVMFATRPVSVRVMLIVFPIYRVTLHAFWMLLLWFAADLAQTLLTRGVMKGAGINYVAHAGGFAFGFLVGLVARAHGVMRRYESVPSGEIWFGYWPARLEREHKLKQIQASKRERLLAARGAREVDYR